MREEPHVSLTLIHTHTNTHALRHTLPNTHPGSLLCCSSSSCLHPRVANPFLSVAPPEAFWEFLSYLGLSRALSSLVLPVRFQQPAATLMLRWPRSVRSRSPSDWLKARSGRPVGSGVGALGCELMVRSRWLRLRRTMRALLVLAGRDRWLNSSWDR